MKIIILLGIVLMLCLAAVLLPRKIQCCPNASLVGFCDVCNGYHFGEIQGNFTIERLELGIDPNEVKE